EILGREFERNCADVFVQAIQLGSAGDRRHPGFLRQQPGERDLGRRGLLPFSDAGEQTDQDLIRLERLRREARQRAAEIGGVELRIRTESASEEALAERTVRNKADSEFFQSWDYFLLRSPGPQRVLALERRERLDRMREADRLHARF